jgi:hypothetical protein
VLGFSLFGWEIFPTRVRHWRRGGAGSIFTCPDITAGRRPFPLVIPLAKEGEQR